MDLVYQALSADATLKEISGLKIYKETPTGALASTPEPGNKRVLVNKEGEVRLEVKTGCQGTIMSERVRIHTIVKSTQGGENARTQADIIRKRIRELMVLAEFPGTGWLYHIEAEDRWPTPPTATRAYHILAYDMATTFGKT